MALSLEQKKAVVAEVAEVAGSAHSVIAAEYTGITVGEMTDLRAKARTESVHMQVVKNSLARRAFKGTDYECMVESMTGPLILAFSQEDPGAAARVVKTFSRENKKLVVKLISIGGKLLGPEDLARLADMPTKDQAISMLMSVMTAPVTKLARTLSESQAMLVRTLAAIRDQKQA